MNAIAPATVTHIHAPENNYKYTQVSTNYDEELQLQWLNMHPTPHACFHIELVNEFIAHHVQIKKNNQFSEKPPIKYNVLSCDIPGVFNFGGDLKLFRDLIAKKDTAAMTHYGYACIEGIHHSATLHQHGITQIALVQGDALGGGFECALSANVIIAERSANLGLPEVLFNLFPGMGAYSFLSRKIGTIQAEKIILSGKLYSAEEMFKLGIVDILAEDGHGETAVYEYIQKENRARNTYASIRKVADRCNPITWEELKDVIDIWVESAMNLTQRDLRMMERIVNRQDKFSAQSA